MNTMDGLPVSSTGARSLLVNAKVVVSAAGAIHSPALLLRSHLHNRKIGKHLTLHPVLAVSGLFPNINTGTASGVSMGVVVNDPPIEAEGPGEKGFRVAVESPPVHPGLFGSMAPWRGNALVYKYYMLLWKNLASFLALTRDRSQESNRVVLSAEGEPVIHYTVAEVDKPMLKKGLETQVRLMIAAGAAVIFPIHENFEWLTRPRDEVAVKSFIDRLLSDCLTPSRHMLFSAHQMSTCRMASTAAEGVVRETGETWECRDLFVVDASVFPTSLGINPMLTIAAFAHLSSTHIVERLNACTGKNDSLRSKGTKVLAYDNK